MIRALYVPGYAFPAWALKREEWDSAAWRETVALHHAVDSKEDVQWLLREREPCNIGMRDTQE